jgi:hypothetical protein
LVTWEDTPFWIQDEEGASFVFLFFLLSQFNGYGILAVYGWARLGGAGKRTVLF